LVQALVISRLDYNNAHLFGLPKKTVAPLQRVQNAAARVISRTRKRDHISPVLHSLHWLSIQQRIEYKLLNITYKIIQGRAPTYLRQCNRHLFIIIIIIIIIFIIIIMVRSSVKGKVLAGSNARSNLCLKNIILLTILKTA
jgi:hypothetical protein